MNILKSCSFLSEFLTNLNEELDDLFSKYQNLKPKEISLKKNTATEQILDHLTTVHIKKITCETEFDAYSLLKLFKALDKIKEN